MSRACPNLPLLLSMGLRCFAQTAAALFGVLIVVLWAVHPNQYDYLRTTRVMTSRYASPLHSRGFPTSSVGFNRYVRVGALPMSGIPGITPIPSPPDTGLSFPIVKPDPHDTYDLMMGRRRGSRYSGDNKNNKPPDVNDEDGLNIVITGAAGRTGKLLAQDLWGMDEGVRQVRCVVHSAKSQSELNSDGLYDTHIADVYKNPKALEDPMDEADVLVILTSAMPKIKTRSLIRLAFAKLFRRKAARPKFRFKQTPEQVDWIGQKNQIDEAKRAGVKHVILVSSMGGSDPSNMLNKIGDGNILLWKRKAERYLISSGLNYTIIHPGGLTDKPGDFEPILGVDDTLLKRPTRSISRRDLVEVILQAIFEPAAIGKAFDVIASETPRDDSEYDWDAFFASAGHCDYSTPDVESILAIGKVLASRAAVAA